MQKPRFDATPRGEVRGSLGQHGTYLGERRHDQVIAVSGGKRERKPLDVRLKDDCDIKAVMLNFISVSHTDVIPTPFYLDSRQD